MFIGAHVSIAKGFTKAVQTADSIGANTMQFFTRNPRGAKAKKFDAEDVRKYKELQKKLKFGAVVAHSPYTINLASSVEDSWNFSIDTTVDDLLRLGELEAPYLCLHPGRHVGSGVSFAIERISQGLNRIFEAVDNNTMILLETMSGSGTELGSNFEELQEIITSCKYKERLGICFDTCHVFSAGYNIKSELNNVLDHFDKIIGLSSIRAFHLNDSLKPLGSKVDRHALIGEGELGLAFFDELVNIEYFRNIPFILETPGGIELYPKEINMLRTRSGL